MDGGVLENEIENGRWNLLNELILVISKFIELLF